jgi:hypothetical protein
MANHPDSEPLQELKHEAVPGYGRVFAICFAAMALYLLLILVSSPGAADAHHDHKHDTPDAQSH